MPQRVNYEQLTVDSLVDVTKAVGLLPKDDEEKQIVPIVTGAFSALIYAMLNLAQAIRDAA